MQTWRYNISAIFHNLTYLDLTFDLPPLLRETRKAKWIWLLNLLYKFPKLQTLIIDEVFHFKFLSCLFIYLFSVPHFKKNKFNSV